jgi:hypothetical protein
MISVPTVPSMHENVHERAKEERQIKEYAQDVSAVLGEQQQTRNGKETQHNQCRPRGKKTTLIVQRHWCRSAMGV